MKKCKRKYLIAVKVTCIGNITGLVDSFVKELDYDPMTEEGLKKLVYITPGCKTKVLSITPLKGGKVQL